MTNEKRRFTVISNEKTTEDNFRKERLRAYQTNPVNIQGESLREQLMKFTNGEGGRRFTVEDLLRS
jgi:hypothetical protein